MEAERGAIASRDAAVAAQQESALNSGRIARGMEEQAAAARAAAEVRHDPWEVMPGSFRRTLDRRPYMVRFDPDPVPTVFATGDAVEIFYARAGAIHRLPRSW